MSTMKADLLQNRLGTDAPSVTKGQFVRSWGRINQQPATPVLDGGFNISGLTDSAVGSTYFNFATPFVSVLTMTGVVAGTAMASYTSVETDIPALTTTQGMVRHLEAAAPTDTALATAIVVGVLA